MSDSVPPRPRMASAKDRIYKMPYLLLVITTLTWAGHVVVAKSVSDEIPPFSLAFWRCLSAVLILLPFGWSCLRNDWPVVRRSYPILIAIAIPAIVLFNTFLYTALETTTAINSGLISISTPAVIVLLSALILRQSIRWDHVIGLVLSLGGAMLVVIRGEWRVLTNLVFVEGDLWMVAAAISTALYSVLLHFRPSIHSLSLTVIMFTIGSVLLFPLYLWDLLRDNTFQLTVPILGAVGYIAVFPSVVAYFCWNRGIHLVGASRAGLLMCFVPLYVAVLSYLFLGERLHWYHFVGFLFIMGGVIMFNRTRR